MRVVAEGVEDAAVWAALHAIGCDVVQGYALSRPLPTADFLRWLATHPVAGPAAAVTEPLARLSG
jgi:EAL domain-containing protein (putative c-di-GMP-specific phosphodiesterase class I)